MNRASATLRNNANIEIERILFKPTLLQYQAFVQAINDWTPRLIDTATYEIWNPVMGLFSQTVLPRLRDGAKITTDLSLETIRIHPSLERRKPSGVPGRSKFKPEILINTRNRNIYDVFL